MVFGALEKDSLKAMADMSGREAFIFLPLVVLTILFGFYPSPILDVLASSVDHLTNQINVALDAAASAKSAGAN